MGEVRVVDRGGREIVVFLSGDVGTSMATELDAAIDEVDALERIGLLERAIVDLQAVTAMDPRGVRFLQALQQRGALHGFDLDLTGISGPAHQALEQAEWPVGIGSTPGASEPRTPSGGANQKSTDEDAV